MNKELTHLASAAARGIKNPQYPLAREEKLSGEVPRCSSYSISLRIDARYDEIVHYRQNQLVFDCFQYLVLVGKALV